MGFMRLLAVAVLASGAISGVTSLGCGVSSPQADVAPLREADGYTIPFQYDSLLSPLVVIPVAVNGHTVHVYVETGAADALVLDRAIAKRLKLSPTGPSVAGPNGPRPVTPTIVRVLQLFGTKANDVPASYTDLGPMRRSLANKPIDGFLGLAALKLFTIRFDFALHKMTLFYKHHAPYNPAGSSILPMIARGSRYYVRISTGGGANADLAVDTGSDGTDIPQPVAERTHPLAVSATAFEDVHGVHPLPRLLLPAVTLGSFAEPRVAVNVMRPGAECHLGLDLLARFRVTIDFRNRLLTLQRAEDYAKRTRLLGYAGISLVRKRGAVVVGRIDAASPAASAGLRIGDALVGVDGRGVGGLSDGALQALVDGAAGTTAALTVSRSGRRLRVSFLRADEFAGARLADKAAGQRRQ